LEEQNLRKPRINLTVIMTTKINSQFRKKSRDKETLF